VDSKNTLFSITDLKTALLERKPTQMKLLALTEVLLVNVLLIALLFWITSDYGFRAAYWGSEGFTPSTMRYPLFLITSASKGPILIPGLITVDWQQVVVIALVAIDGLYAWSAFTGRHRSVESP
jgi:hypothetical protein